MINSKVSMKFNEIGRTGVQLPSIIFGTSALGNLYRAIDHQTKLRIVKECLSAFDGPVVFDTAGKYGAGMALEELGKILNETGVSEERVIISNKLGWLQSPLKSSEPQFEKGVWFDLHHDAYQDISYEGIQKCWEQGNQLLGGKFLPQLVSVHDPDEYLLSAANESERKSRFRQIVEAYKALKVLKDAGKTKAIGIGAKNWKIIEEISRYVHLDWVMFANSLTLYRHPEELLYFMAALHQKGITVINSAVFNAGFLTGGEYFDYVPADPENPEFADLFKWREVFFECCRKFSVKPSHACIQFGLSHPAISAVSLNTSKPANVKTNVREVTRKLQQPFFKSLKDHGIIDPAYPFV